MENQDNIAGLGKNHDKEAHDHDLQKKQSEAKPGAENIDMMPNSVNKSGTQGFSQSEDKKNEEQADGSAIHHQAEEYAQGEHDKAKDWEDTTSQADGNA